MKGASSTFSQPSSPPEPGKRVSGTPPRKRGVLSYVVSEALKDSRLYDESGLLTGSALERHVYATVPMLTDKQSPIVDYERIPDKEMIIARWVPRTKQTIQVTFASAASGTAEIFFGNNMRKPFASYRFGQLPLVLDLDAGFLYKIAICGSDRKALFETIPTDEVQDVRIRLRWDSHSRRRYRHAWHRDLCHRDGWSDHQSRHPRAPRRPARCPLQDQVPHWHQGNRLDH